MNNQKQTDKISALQKSHALLLQRLSHDLLIPMNGIVATCNQADQQPTHQHEVKDTVTHTVNSLISIVQSMSVFASLLRGDIYSEEKSFSIKEMFGELDSLHQYMARTSKVTIRHKFLTDTPAQLVGDYHHTRQLLAGFVSNALKHTRNGTITLSAELLEKKGDRVVLRLKVSDSGKGIPDEKLARIREALQSDVEPGMLISGDIGVGLALAKALTEKMGWKFAFESKYAVGSSFWIDVPMKEGGAQKVVEQSEQHPYQTDNPRRILLVEDNYLNQRFVAAALLKAGHSLEIAENGQVAMDKYRSKSYDLILMDIQLPLFDGIETTKKIRKEEKKFRRERIPIIAVTAYAIEHDKKKCLDAGMDEYLTKPFKPEELLSLINSL